MIKKVITYTDFDGNERTDSFYFNLTEAELMEMENSKDGGMGKMIREIIESKDIRGIMSVFKEILLLSYGEKSPDGKYFRKSKELSEDFSHSQAYSDLYMQLATDDKAASDFINGLIPAKLASQIDKSEVDAQVAAFNS